MMSALPLDPLQRAVARRAVEVDPRERGLGAVIDDVLDLFDVDRRSGQHPEDVRQHARTVAVPDRRARGVAELRASRLTTLGTSPVAWNACTIRITSCAIATCAWSVDAPTWCVP